MAMDAIVDCAGALISFTQKVSTGFTRVSMCLTDRRSAAVTRLYHIRGERLVADTTIFDVLVAANLSPVCGEL